MVLPDGALGDGLFRHARFCVGACVVWQLCLLVAARWATADGGCRSRRRVCHVMALNPAPLRGACHSLQPAFATHSANIRRHGRQRYCHAGARERCPRAAGAERLPRRHQSTARAEHGRKFRFPLDAISCSDASPHIQEHCTTDRPTPSGEKPTGQISKLGGVDAYIAKPADYPHSPSKLLLLLTGGTGINSTNNQLQADKYASEGFLVVMPDQFDNDPAPNSVDMTEISQEASWLESIKLRTAEGIKSFMIDMWLARHTPEKVLPTLYKVLEGAREEFADAVANGGGVYGVGYCFGAKYILILAGQSPDTIARSQSAPKDEEQGPVNKEPVLKAGAVAHPTMLTREDLEAVRAPVYFAAVNNDPMLSEEEVLTPGRRAMEINKVEHEIQVFSDVPHGFAVLGDYDDPKIKQSQAQAFGQMLGWIQSH